MKSFLCFLCIISFELCSCMNNTNDNSTIDLDVNRNVTELITSKGYPVEEYEAETEDGYILSLQRIPKGARKQYTRKKKKAVLLIHGLFAESSDWVINFPEQSLGFILADNGYDVWLGNTRGSTYSLKHKILNSDIKEFWNFSIDEWAEYDIPAMINLVLNVTESEQIFIIGVSLGTTSVFAFLSQNPEYNTKIKLFIALAPITTAEHMTSIVRSLLPFSYTLLHLTRLGRIYHFPILHGNKQKTNILLKYILFDWPGTNPEHINMTRTDVYMAHISSASIRTLIHAKQLVLSKRFQKYDYGMVENLRHYNSSSPPEYNISRITAPVALIWGENDTLAVPRDVHQLEENLSSLVMSYGIPEFGHGDFLKSLEADKLLHSKIIQLLSKYH